jgi:hypothetical protein
MHRKPDIRFVGVLIEMVDAPGIEAGGPALDAVHLIAFGQEEFGQIGTVLAGDSGDEGCFHSDILSWRLKPLKQAKNFRRAINMAILSTKQLLRHLP